MKQLKFFGLGGQGVVTCAKTLSKAVSLYEDEYAITVPSYGHERRGAPVFTDMVIDSVPVLLNCFVYEPDMVIVTDETVIDKGINVGKGMREDAVLVINCGTADVAKKYADTFGFKTVYYVDATTIAMECIGRSIPNSAMLGALAKTGLVRIESAEAAICESFGKAGENNARAARKAYEAVRTL